MSLHKDGRSNSCCYFEHVSSSFSFQRSWASAAALSTVVTDPITQEKITLMKINSLNSSYLNQEAIKCCIERQKRQKKTW